MGRRPTGAETSESLHFRAPGYSFSVASGALEFLDSVGRLLSGLEAEVVLGGGPTYRVVDRGPAYAPSRWLVYRDGDVVLDAPGAAVALEALLSDVDHSVVRAVTAEQLAVHAGAVEVGGRVVMLPAASGSGKTTLTAAAVAAGGGYVTDELSIVDPVTLHVSAYARPLCVKPGSHRVVARLVHDGRSAPDPDATWFVPPEVLGASSRGGLLSAVVVPSYQAGSSTNLLPMTRAEAILAIASQTSFVARRDMQVLQMLKALVVGATCHRLRFSDAAEAGHRLLDVLR